MVQNFVYKNTRGQTYHLNSKLVHLRNMKNQTIYYFSLDERHTACPLPEDREVTENRRSGLPMVRRIKEVA